MTECFVSLLIAKMFGVFYYDTDTVRFAKVVECPIDLASPT